MQIRVLQQRLKRTTTCNCAFGKASLIAVRDLCALGVAQHLFAGHFTGPNIGVAFTGCGEDDGFPMIWRFQMMGQRVALTVTVSRGKTKNKLRQSILTLPRVWHTPRSARVW